MMIPGLEWNIVGGAEVEVGEATQSVLKLDEIDADTVALVDPARSNEGCIVVLAKKEEAMSTTFTALEKSKVNQKGLYYPRV